MWCVKHAWCHQFSRGYLLQEGVKWIFCVLCYNVEKKHVVANLTIMVHSVEVCCVSKTKLCIPNQVVPLTVFLRIILKLLILTPLFYKNYTTISDISSRNVQHRLLIIPMERENLSCSMKNIPMLCENSCFLKNTEKSS